MNEPTPITPEAGAPTPASLPDGQTTALAIIVAPDELEQAVAAIPPDRLLGVLWWVQQIIDRANAAKKALLIESTMALDRGELDPRITADGHRYQLRQDTRTDWSDLPGLFFLLESMGVSVSDLARAVSGARITDLRTVASKLPDDVRQDALDSIESHRQRVPTQVALVDLDDPYRRGR